MEWSAILALAGFLGLNFAAAASGAVFQPGEWYRGLRKPTWNPPDWLFPIAWAALYLMIAIAGWLVWRAAGFSGAALALSLYVLQLALNAAWSWVFFGLKRMGWALAECGALWLAIAATILAFAPISGTAALLMLPYLVWVSFAAFLNFTLLRLNPEAA
jgi:tryptophan-rich sensory protein